jgi:hypothetical protein
VKASQPKRTYDPECVPLLVIDHFNGKTMLLKQIRISANKLHLCMDAARSLGFGVIFENEWLYGLIIVNEIFIVHIM